MESIDPMELDRVIKEDLQFVIPDNIKIMNKIQRLQLYGLSTEDYNFSSNSYEEKKTPLQISDAEHQQIVEQLKTNNLNKSS